MTGLVDAEILDHLEELASQDREEETLLAISKAMRTERATGAAIANMLSAADQGLLTKDMVVLPEHYARFKIEPVRFIVENGLNFFQGNILKYVLRHDAKNGIEDLKKAQRYLEMFIKFIEGDPNWWKRPE